MTAVCAASWFLPGMERPWGKDDTERYLRDNPLPADFVWRGRSVCPQYHIRKGYGFWLRTTPYHPGLFEALHGFIARCDVYPTPERMAEAMTEIEAAEKEQTNLDLGI